MNIQFKRAKLKYVAILLAGISTASISTMAHADWSITGLGTLGGTFISVGGINDSGQVVGGVLNADGNSHAFITGSNGVGMTDVHTLVNGGESDGFSDATNINNSGQVVGWTEGHAFITGANGIGMTELGTLGGLQPSLAMASTIPDKWWEVLELLMARNTLLSRVLTVSV